MVSRLRDGHTGRLLFRLVVNLVLAGAGTLDQRVLELSSDGGRHSQTVTSLHSFATHDRVASCEVSAHSHSIVHMLWLHIQVHSIHIVRAAEGAATFPRHAKAVCFVSH